MTTAVVIVAAVVGLACPIHMWWRMRRGKAASCCVPARPADPLVDLRERQRALAERIGTRDPS